MVSLDKEYTLFFELRRKENRDIYRRMEFRKIHDTHTVNSYTKIYLEKEIRKVS